MDTRNISCGGQEALYIFKTLLYWATGTITLSAKYSASAVSRRLSVRLSYHSGRAIHGEDWPSLVQNF